MFILVCVFFSGSKTSTFSILTSEKKLGSLESNFMTFLLIVVESFQVQKDNYIEED